MAGRFVGHHKGQLSADYGPKHRYRPIISEELTCLFSQPEVMNVTTQSGQGENKHVNRI